MRQDVQMMCPRVTSGKKITIENVVGGALVATATRVDVPERTLIEDRAKNTSDDLMEFGEKKHTSRSGAEMFGPTHAQQIAGNACFMPYCARCGQNGWEICRRGSKKDSKKICC